MQRIFSGYLKAHGYAIAVAALTFGCIFAADVASVGDNLRPLNVAGELNGAAVADEIYSETYFRLRPLEQLVFSLVWVFTGTIFLVGMLFEKKETIFPFATIFAIDWCVFLVQHLTKLERRNFRELMLSADTAVLIVIPVYVVYTLVVLYRLFELRQADSDDEDDVESARKPVKFSVGGDDIDDSWIS